VLQLQLRLDDPLGEMQGKGVSHDEGIKQTLRQLQADLDAMPQPPKALQIVGQRIVLLAPAAVTGAAAQEPAQEPALEFACVAYVCMHAPAPMVAAVPIPLLPVLHAVLLTRLYLTMSWNALQPQL
jgi:hypothetical protein